jgi:hypothetical protein
MRSRLLPVLLVATACRSHDATKAAMPELRLTPAEVQRVHIGNTQGVRTTILYGTPSKAGMYAVLMYVPANTNIQPHSHRDNRMATVVAGTLRVGYGDTFDAAALEELPPGSIYSEPEGRSHFAQTRNEPVVVQIVGYGPTNTLYVNTRGEPRVPTR